MKRPGPPGVNIIRREEMMKKAAAIVTLMFGMLALTGCNTVEGFGKDLSKVGGKIEKKAEEKKGN
ncbi:entericidin [Sulfuricella sp. T08]|nr:entericidin [Sulfuricella sp. T08]